MENCRVSAKSFSGVKMRYKEDYLQPTMREVPTNINLTPSVHEILERSLREKCPYSQFFWSVFSRIRAESVLSANTGKYGPEKLQIHGLKDSVPVRKLRCCC